jgi:ribonuclease T1
MIQGKPVNKMGGQGFGRQLSRDIGRWLRKSAKSAAAGVVLGALVGALASGSASARETPSGTAPSAAASSVALTALPVQAQDTHQRILSGGPFPYAKDGSVFGNRERRLPGQARGYYREYTVATPGSSNRGARRIVCGGREPKTPDVCYYTQDHYASFQRISR